VDLADRIDLTGDAQILFTAPFLPGADPLDFRPASRVPADGILDDAGRLVLDSRSLDPLLRGSLTYGNPSIGHLAQFAGTDGFARSLAAAIEGIVGLVVTVTVSGLIFPDGYSSTAVRIVVPDGWTGDTRARVLTGFGPAGRNQVGDALRDMLLPAVAAVADRCCPDAVCETLMPYFNCTYVGTTTHPRPGRAALPDELRMLVYPRSPAPIQSNSPWLDEFFYAGYAFSLLASAAPAATLEQLEHLLLHLDVLYARMEASATAADKLIRGTSRDEDVDWLIALERRLRADYQALVRPTFSYDHHVLRLRDSLLFAWETDKTRERTEILLEMARQAVERQLAEAQARRVGRVNLVLTILAILSLVSSIDSVLSLWDRMFP
jgi:hypothetical protein